MNDLSHTGFPGGGSFPSEFRGILENLLQSFEAGRFQQFMLKFLPLMDGKYAGITRFGGTPTGKTTPGVPDSIKTFPNGDEIACECGTDLDYWTPPKDSADYDEKWKPVSDALKCIGRMTRPIEIVLASNQPIPKKHPSVRTDVIDYLQQKTSATITPLSLENIATCLDTIACNAGGQELLREFFPTVYTAACVSFRNSLLETTFAQGLNIGFPLDHLREIVESCTRRGLPDGAISNSVQERFGFDSSRFRSSPQVLNGVQRKSVAPEPLRNPLGKCCQLQGVPKIGKSLLCSEVLEGREFSTEWYLVPTEKAQHPEFVHAVLVDIFSTFWKRSDVVSARRQGRLTQLPLGSFVPPVRPQIFVMDNAHLLGKADFVQFNEALAHLKTSDLMRHIGVVFVTNRNLALQCPAIDQNTIAPRWNPAELLSLLDALQIPYESSEAEKYGELLQSMSGGHPLCARSLARKYPGRAALVASAFSGGPAVADADLSNEVKSLLYQEILTNADAQNFVQRLSLLMRAKSNVLECLRLKVQPPIAATTQRLFEEIGGAVFDGDPETGLGVSPTFQQIARRQLSNEEQRSVYRVAAAELCKSVEGVCDGDGFLEGIFYSVLARDFERAFGGASLIFYGLSKSEGDKALIRSVLDRLDFLEAVILSEDPRVRISQFSFYSIAAYHYSIIGEDKRAAKMLTKIDLNALKAFRCDDDVLNDLAKNLYVVVIAQSVLHLPIVDSPKTTLNSFVEVIMGEDIDVHLLNLAGIVPLLISKLSSAQILSLDYDPLIAALAARRISLVADLGLLLGHSASQETELAKLQTMQFGSNIAHDLFRQCICASVAFCQRKYADVAESIAAIESAATGLGSKPASLGRTFLQFKGDTFAELQDAPKAMEAFMASNAQAEMFDAHMLGWNKFRMGLLETVPSVSLNLLQEAAASFEEWRNFNGASRALGAAAVVMLKEKRYREAIESARKIASWFYRDGKTQVGPALRVLSAQMFTMASQIAGDSIPPAPTGVVSPGLEPQIYRTISDDLHLEVGGMFTFTAFANLAKVTGLRGLSLELLRQAFSFRPIPPSEASAAMWNFCSLLEQVEPNEIDATELRDLLRAVAETQPVAGDSNEGAFFACIFSPLHAKAQGNGALWGRPFLPYLSIAKEIAGMLSTEKGCRWKVHLNYYDGLANLDLGNEKIANAMLQEAFDAARTDGNWRLAIEAGGLLSFRLIECCPSMKVLAERQYATLQAIRDSGRYTEGQLRNFGINLFRCWKNIRWTRLRTSDLRVSEYLHKPANSIGTANSSEAEAGAVMISLLLKVFDDVGGPSLPFAEGNLPNAVKRLLV